MKPAYEKAATHLGGLAKVAAVNCEDEINKPFCGTMGVRGFPTLKLVKPGKKAGKPIVEDYQGPRTAKAIVDAVIDKMPNHVKRLKDGEWEKWLESGKGAKAVLFSEKGTTSALLKAIAVEFLGSIQVAQIRDKETEAVAKFGVEKFPALILVPASDGEAVQYDGEMKKDPMVKFLSQAAEPNPDPAPKQAKSSSSTDEKKASEASSKFSKASASHASSEAQTDKASQNAETLEEIPTESPDPIVVTDDAQKPIKLPEVAPPVSLLRDAPSLQHKCLNTKAGTCILAVLPEDTSDVAAEAVASLSEIHHKHISANRKLFPFYQLPASNAQAVELREKLSLGSGIELIAVNGKRSWYRHYAPSMPSFSQRDIEDWIDSIRMDDSPKMSLPEGLVLSPEDLPPKPEPTIKLAHNAEDLREQLRANLPDGMQMPSDDELDRIMAEAGAQFPEHQEAQRKGKEEQDDGVPEHGEL